MVEHFAACDWTSSPLGPPESWPESLKTATRLVLSAKAQIVLFWGPEYVPIYNAAYASAIGDRHPRALGRPAIENYYDLWDEFEPQLRRVRELGAGFQARDRGLYVERHGHGEKAWFDVSYTPVFEESGAVGGVLVIVNETTERVLAERRQSFLLELSDTLRPLGDAGAIKAAATGVLGKSLRASRCFYSEIEGDLGMIEGCYHDGVASLDGRYTISEYGKVLVRQLQTGGVVLSRDTLLNPELTPAERATNQAMEMRARITVPLIKDGRLVACLAVHQSEPRSWTAAEVDLVKETAERTWDAVERARAVTELARAEQRRAASYDALPVGIGSSDATGKLFYINREMQRYMPTGVIPSRDKSRLWRWRAFHADGSPVEPDDFPGARALRGERVVPGMEMLYTDDDDRTIWTRFAAVPVSNEGGCVGGCVVIVTDIDALKRAEETQALLVGELQHRTRNLLAIVRSIARQTQRTAENPQEFFGSFHERLAALSRVQALLSQGEGHGADLRQLIDSELIAHGASADDPRVSVAGPHVTVSSKAVQVLALALHELCTNAVKHGALGQDQAKLMISWNVSYDDGQRMLDLDWTESGVRLTWPSPPRTGFGRQLVERAIPYDLNGETSWSARPDGVHCSLRVPVAGEHVS